MQMLLQHPARHCKLAESGKLKEVIEANEGASGLKLTVFENAWHA